LEIFEDFKHEDSSRILRSRVDFYVDFSRYSSLKGIVHNHKYFQKGCLSDVSNGALGK